MIPGDSRKVIRFQFNSISETRGDTGFKLYIQIMHNMAIVQYTHQLLELHMFDVSASAVVTRSSKFPPPSHCRCILRHSVWAAPVYKVQWYRLDFCMYPNTKKRHSAWAAPVYLFIGLNYTFTRTLKPKRDILLELRECLSFVLGFLISCRLCQ